MKFYKTALDLSSILCHRRTWNFFVYKPIWILYAYSYRYSMQTKFHVPRSHSFWEKSEDNLKLASHFSPILCDRGTWNFFCILTHMNTLCKQNFMFLGRTVFNKNAMISCKNSKLHNSPNKQLLCDRRTWNRFCILSHVDTLCKPNFFLQVFIVFFSKTVRVRNMKFVLHWVSIWVNIQNKISNFSVAQYWRKVRC